MALSSPRRLPCEIEAQLKDGRWVCLRTIRPSDEENIREGIEAMSDRARYLRFFSALRTAPDSIVKRLSAVDGHGHIGWGAILLDGQEYPPIAAAHAVRIDDKPGTGELAVAVLDDYQGLGLARMLVAAVLSDCVAEDLGRLEMQVLGENRAAVELLLGLGAEIEEREGSVTTFGLDAAKAIAQLRAVPQSPGLTAVLAEI